MRFSPLDSSENFMAREVVSVFVYLLQFPSYDVINDVITNDVISTFAKVVVQRCGLHPGREPS